MKKRILLISLVTSFLLISCNQTKKKETYVEKNFTEAQIAKLTRVKQKLVAPPFVPEHDQVAKGAEKVVEIRLEVDEKKMVIDDEGTEIWAFTYNGTVPGPMIVVHEGDFVELTLVNLAKNSMEHNIDFHSSTGAHGAGSISHVGPGEEVVIRFQAIKAGVFIYHCAPGGVMTPWHVVHGMNGAMMVLPRKGLDDGYGNPLKYDRAYYVGEQDFYIPQDKNGNYKKYDSAMESMEEDIEVMKTLIPSHIVFNGSVGALTGDNSLKAKVGENVLILHSQANYDTRPHLIGGHGDYVWERGSFNSIPKRDLETWFIAGGSAGAALYKFRQPGNYVYLNHNLIEAVIKGAAAHFDVEGEWSDTLMKVISEAKSSEE